MPSNKTNGNKKKFLEALTDAKGIVMTACAVTGLSRTNFYDWCKEDAEFKAQVDDIQEVAIDFVESKLMEKINGVSVSTVQGDVYDVPPSDTAIIFYLKTKGKKRGYVERTEVDNINPQNIPSPIVNVYQSGPPTVNSETDVNAERK